MNRNSSLRDKIKNIVEPLATHEFSYYDGESEIASYEATDAILELIAESLPKEIKPDGIHGYWTLDGQPDNTPKEKMYNACLYEVRQLLKQEKK